MRTPLSTWHTCARAGEAGRREEDREQGSTAASEVSRRLQPCHRAAMQTGQPCTTPVQTSKQLGSLTLISELPVVYRQAWRAEILGMCHCGR